MTKFLFCLSMPFLAYGFGLEWLGMYQQFRLTDRWGYFVIGVIACLVFQVMFHQRLRFFHTLEHELTHTVAGLICFKAPSSLSVNVDGSGVVTLSGGNVFISLAPYFFPTVPYAALALALIASSTHQLWITGTLGASVAWHIVSTLREFHLKQPDIQQSGVGFSPIPVNEP
ncbi:MAG: M50 family metallopeptidase [Blastocatellia bacterium]